MRFLYPLGLLGLLGIPILIIIYIIKNKYTEQVVPSTYLWKLSEKFLPKKKPITLISGIISLILQILAVVIVSLLIAQPIFTIPNSAKDYCLILDGSGSMNYVNGETTRMELGKDKIETIIADSKNGSTYTLIYVGATSKVVYEKLSDKDKAIELLNRLEPSGVTIGLDGIISHVQKYFNSNKSLESYFVTDKDYKSENVNIINVSNHEENYAVYETTTMVDGNNLKISTNLVSYESSTTLNIEIYVDDELVKKDDVEVTKGVEKNLESYIDILDYESLEVRITNQDALALDNQEILFNVKKTHEYKTLIVSDRPFYLETIINSVGNTKIDIVSREQYTSEMTGYSLYVFDSFAPTVLPDDGTIWLFGASTSIDKSGFSVQDVIENEEGLAATYPKNSSSIYKTLTSGLFKEQVYLKKYYKYGLYKNFTILLTHEGDPLIFTGLTDNGNREVVFAFDLHDSNMPLLLDYITLSKNLLDYSFPVIIEDSNYVCGETVSLNVLSNCDSIRVENPKGVVNYLDVSSEITSFVTTEVGVYKISVMNGDKETIFKIFVNMPIEEQHSTEVAEFDLIGVKENNYRDGIYDELIILFIILAVIYMADWMVYCYEQYQLR